EALVASPLFAALRAQLGLRARPLLVGTSASGAIDVAQPALADALVATTPRGEARLRGRLPAGARLAVFDAERIPLAALLGQLRDEGLGRVLTEGGPTLVGELIAAGLLDELFLTTAPALFGRSAGDRRKSLVDGSDVARTAPALWSAPR